MNVFFPFLTLFYYFIFFFSFLFAPFLTSRLFFFQMFLHSQLWCSSLSLSSFLSLFPLSFVFPAFNCIPFIILYINNVLPWIQTYYLLPWPPVCLFLFQPIFHNTVKLNWIQIVLAQTNRTRDYILLNCIIHKFSY